MYKEERYERTTPDGEVETRVVIEQSGSSSGLLELCAVCSVIVFVLSGMIGWMRNGDSYRRVDQGVQQPAQTVREN